MKGSTLRSLLSRLVSDFANLDDDLPPHFSADASLFVETETVDASLIIKITPRKKAGVGQYVSFAIGFKVSNSSVASSYGMTHGPFNDIQDCLNVGAFFVDPSSVILGFDHEGKSTELYEVTKSLAGGTCWAPKSA